MTISAEIVRDSITNDGSRITTFVLRYPRFIHAEFMTHRAFSRNASSSRAIPFNKLVWNTWSDIAYPLEFRANQRGMQAGAALPRWKELLARAIWASHSYISGALAWGLSELGAHKQYCNRLLEPTGHISVVVTATEWANFFALRYHKMAQPEICELAKQMWEVYSASKPGKIHHMGWHLPFVSDLEIKAYFEGIDKGVATSTNDKTWLPLIKRSVARCARVSYLNHFNEVPTEEEDLKLYDRLLGAKPIHASPAEHQAKADFKGWWSGNLHGWVQFRKTLSEENIEDFKGPIDG